MVKIIANQCQTKYKIKKQNNAVQYDIIQCSKEQHHLI